MAAFGNRADVPQCGRESNYSRSPKAKTKSSRSTTRRLRRNEKDVEPAIVLYAGVAFGGSPARERSSVVRPLVPGRHRKAAGISARHSNRVFDNPYAKIMAGYTALGASASVADYDGDGYDDVFVTDSKLGGKNHLYHNNGTSLSPMLPKKPASPMATTRAMRQPTRFGSISITTAKPDLAGRPVRPQPAVPEHGQREIQRRHEGLGARQLQECHYRHRVRLRSRWQTRPFRRFLFPAHQYFQARFAALLPGEFRDRQ